MHQTLFGYNHYYPELLYMMPLYDASISPLTPSKHTTKKAEHIALLLIRLLFFLIP